MESRKLKIFERSVFAIALTILITVVALVVLYFSNFGGIESKFSNKISDWAHVGDYIAGTAGSLLSLAAFLGILFTIYLQVQQIHILRSQSVADEMQRLILSTSVNIDNLMYQIVSDQFSDKITQNKKFTLFDVIVAKYYFDIRIKRNIASPERQEVFLHEEVLLQEEFTRITNFYLPRLSIELNQISWAIDKNQKNGGPKEVLGFYLNKYINIIFWLYKCGHIEERSSTFSVFGFAFASMKNSEEKE